jgi:hypothetical protein
LNDQLVNEPDFDGAACAIAHCEPNAAISTISSHNRGNAPRSSTIG